MKKTSVQLFSARDQIQKNYEETIRKIAAMGYDCVEPAGFPGTTPKDAARLFNELGISAPSMHSQLPLGDKRNEVIETALAIGAKYIIQGYRPEHFDSIDKIKKAAEAFSEAAVVAAEYDLEIGYHNHDYEMNEFDGVPAYRIFADNTDPSVFFEIDTYWVKVGKKDPVTLIKELGERVKLLHIKDGPGCRGKAMLAVGTGVMDFPPIIKAATFADLMVVEIDICDTDMMEALKQSCDYLKSILA